MNVRAGHTTSADPSLSRPRGPCPDNIYRLASKLPSPDGAFSVRELLDRPDALATIERITDVVSVDAPDPELVVTLTALAVLRARAAAERSGR